MKAKVSFTTLSIIVISILSACVDKPDQSTKQTPQKGASIARALLNAEYSVDITSTGKAKLKDGVFQESVVPGSATKTIVHLGKDNVFGDVNDDGAEDAAVTLIVNPGGSGTFTYLALVINEDGIAKPMPSVLLGDRIIVRSIAIHPGSIVVTMLKRKSDEPMSAKPKVEVARTFRLQGDKLVEP